MSPEVISAIEDDVAMHAASAFEPRYVPTFVCRVSGLPATAPTALADGELAVVINNLWDVENRIASARDALSQDLFLFISNATDKRIRNKLLELRRSLFNGKRPSESELNVAATVLDIRLHAAVLQTIRLQDERQVLLNTFQACHERTAEIARDRLRVVLGDEDFQSALALSSATLFRNLETYRSPNGRTSASRLDQIERGLLRYFTRMATKATPFSRFCSIIGGEFVADDNADRPVSTFTGTLRAKRSAIRPNKRISAQLWERLHKQPAVRDRLSVESNPTLIVEGDRFAFLTAIDGSEVFQRMAASDELAIVLELTRAHPSPTFGQVVARLANDARFEATTEEARAFLDRLIDLGFLRTQAVVAEQEANWLEPMLEFLTPIRDEHAENAVRLLSELRESLDQYTIASGSDRARLLSEIRAQLHEGYVRLGLKPREPHELPLYEDATAAAQMQIHQTPELLNALETLGEWVRLTMPLANARAEMGCMRHFFDTFYAASADASGVPLLKFYEDYYREHFKSHLEKTQRAQAGSPEPGYDLNDPFKLEIVRCIRLAGDRLLRVISDAWAANPLAEEVTITRAMLHGALRGVDGAQWTHERSANVFSQLFRAADGTTRIVLPSGNYAPGYGKFFSRFLHLLPERWQSDLFEDNSKLGTSLLAEICGDAAFNANLHPPLLPLEISYPTGQRGGSADQILSSEISVIRDDSDPNTLKLVRLSDGKRVWPIDLGFLSPKMRPPLYQLLMLFSPLRFFSLPLPYSPLPAKHNLPPQTASDTTSATPSIPEVKRRPRVTFEESVVLARRSWFVPMEEFPMQAKSESDADYFLRVARWRLNHGMPRQVYIRVLPLTDSAVNARGSATEPKKDFLEIQAEGADNAGELVDGMPAADEDHDEEKVPEKVHAVNAAPTSATTVRRPRDRQSRDYRKPQFIDFDNPLLVQLFARLPTGLKRFAITLEECLPAADQLPVSNGEPFAFELILQLSFSGASDA